MSTTIQRQVEELPAGHEQREDGVAVFALLLPEFNLRQRLGRGLKHMQWHQGQRVHASDRTLRINLSSVSSSLLMLFTTLSSRVPATPNRLNSSRTLGGEGGGQMQRCRRSGLHKKTHHTCISSTSRWYLKCSSLSIFRSAASTSF